MSDSDEIFDPGIDEDALVDYCMELYQASAEESLAENAPEQYEKLLELQGDPALLPAVEIGPSDREFDEEEVGQGPVIRVRYCPTTAVCDKMSGYYVNVADIYVTVQGMDDFLGVVDWFPEGTRRRNASGRPID